MFLLSMGGLNETDFTIYIFKYKLLKTGYKNSQYLLQVPKVMIPYSFNDFLRD